MIGKKRILAIIPARGGSKRLLGKNMRPLDEVPLIVYSINAAKQCEVIDRIIVSTDSEDIAKVAIDAGAEVDVRSKKLSSDNVTTIDVVKDLLERFRAFDICVTLQPTSPLRTADDIQGSLDLFESKKADAVISVCKAEHPPQWTSTIGKNNEMDIFARQLVQNKRSQDFGDFYRLNGAIYCNSVHKLMEAVSPIFEDNSYAYVMPFNRSIDIDTLEDFELAEFYLSKKK